MITVSDKVIELAASLGDRPENKRPIYPPQWKEVDLISTALLFLNDKVKQLENEIADLNYVNKSLSAHINEIEKEITSAKQVWGHLDCMGNSTWSTYPPGTFTEENITHKAKIIRMEEIKK